MIWASAMATRRRAIALAVGLLTIGVLALGPPAIGAEPLGPGQPTTYRLPLAGPLRVVRGFQAPPTTYGAGHRGVDLAAAAGAPVLAAGAGVVRFAGSVAGRGVVVIAHADGLTTEYEPVRPQVRVGAPVTAGQRIATLARSARASTSIRCCSCDRWARLRCCPIFRRGGEPAQKSCAVAPPRRGCRAGW
jgi:murein DD-endopeptidase MepM/ murein hydrolase activator NlpD